MNRLVGKTAIITGAARGQGEATARLFAEEGCTVILTDVLEGEGKAVTESIGGSARFMCHDISDEAQWIEVVAAAGHVDILVNNAANPLFERIENTGREDVQRLLSVNAIGTFLGVKAVLPMMKAARKGSIVNISSINGLRGTVGMGAYDMCKWAIRGLTKTMALEGAPFNVRANSVHPGAIDTPMLNPTDKPAGEAMAKALCIPFGRVGLPKEIAYASLFLASDEASYVSGAELAVDGAWSSGLSTNIEEV